VSRACRRSSAEPLRCSTNGHRLFAGHGLHRDCSGVGPFE
jgi:hypothetical protein